MPPLFLRLYSVVPRAFVEVSAHILNFRNFPSSFQNARFSVIIHILLGFSSFSYSDRYGQDLVLKHILLPLLHIYFLVGVELLPTTSLRIRFDNILVFISNFDFLASVVHGPLKWDFFWQGILLEIRSVSERGATELIFSICSWLPSLVLPQEPLLVQGSSIGSLGSIPVHENIAHCCYDNLNIN